MDATEQTQQLQKDYQLEELTLALPTHRVDKLTQQQLNDLKEKYQKQTLGYVQSENVWQAGQSAHSINNYIRTLEWQNCPLMRWLFIDPFIFRRLISGEFIC